MAGGPDEWGVPLKNLVEFEKAHGKLDTLLRYHPLSSSLLIPLNHDIPTIYGVVDVDWMFRVAFASRNLFTGWLTYRTAKFYWNLMDPRRGSLRNRLDPGSIYAEANSNAPWVANQWLSGDKTLEQIFAPALAMLQ